MALRNAAVVIVLRMFSSASRGLVIGNLLRPLSSLPSFWMQEKMQKLLPVQGTENKVTPDMDNKESDSADHCHTSQITSLPSKTATGEEDGNSIKIWKTLPSQNHRIKMAGQHASANGLSSWEMDLTGSRSASPARLGSPRISPHGLKRTPSFRDVQAVDAITHGKKSKLSSVCDMLTDNEGKSASQEHENELAELVIVCEPEQASLMMGGLHPRGSLYERPINIDIAKAQHAEFRHQLREHGVKVLTVREVLSYNVEENISARVDLEDLACSALVYTIASGHTLSELAEEHHKWLGDAYKREVIEKMSISQLVDTIMINPTVKLTPSNRDTGFTAYYTFQPLSNLVYTRDQQITTCKGVVMGRLRSDQRQKEVEVMKFCHTKLGLPIVGEVSEGGFLEGGDFFPCGTHLCMMGIGLRSNMDACQQLMDRDLLGTRRLADRMHLDCVFSILSDSCCIMLEDIMGTDSPTRRTVDEYTKDPSTGKYRLSKRTVDEYTKDPSTGKYHLSNQYIRDEGYNIIPISNAHQLAYGCNVLNLGDSRIISVHSPSARQIVKSPYFKGDIHVLDFSSITSMYGSAHCASQVLRRVPRRLMPTDKSSARCVRKVSVSSTLIRYGALLGGCDPGSSNISCSTARSGGNPVGRVTPQALDYPRTNIMSPVIGKEPGGAPEFGQVEKKLRLEIRAAISPALLIRQHATSNILVTCVDIFESQSSSALRTSFVSRAAPRIVTSTASSGISGPVAAAGQHCPSSLVPQAFQMYERSAMTKVSSLVFDLELEDTGMSARYSESSSDATAEDVALLQRFLMPASAAQQKLAEDVAKALRLEACLEDTALLASQLRAMGYNAQAHHALGGGSDCLRNLRHSFVVASLPGSFMCGDHTKYVIDPCFREQFEIAKPSTRYEAVLDAVPPCLIISQDNISRLVNFLCAELTASFQAIDAVVPPWRQSAGMLSKWLPRKSLDENIGPPGGQVASAVASGTELLSSQDGIPNSGLSALSNVEPCKVFSAATSEVSPPFFER
eukprot:gene13898-19825_t